MDGNGRWAQSRGLPRTDGHRHGFEAARRLVENCPERGIKTLTLFAFSSENWRRPSSEVKVLLELFDEGIRKNLSKMIKDGVRITFLGDLSKFPFPLHKLMQKAQNDTKQNDKLHLQIAVNYSGRWDILNAVRQLASAGADLTNLTEEQFDQAILSSSPDLLIRTSGEMRLSNFMLWQLAYTELHFCPIFWPEFGVKELDEAIADYANRQRRYGGLGDNDIKENYG